MSKYLLSLNLYANGIYLIATHENYLNILLQQGHFNILPLQARTFRQRWCWFRYTGFYYAIPSSLSLNLMCYSKFHEGRDQVCPNHFVFSAKYMAYNVHSMNTCGTTAQFPDSSQLKIQ